MKKLWFVGIFTLIVAISSVGVFMMNKEDRYVKMVYADHEEHVNFSYGSHVRQKMDLFIPTTSNSVGLILFIHGGGWSAGDKNVYISSLKEWCNRGYAALAVNYRYANGKNIGNNQIMDDITTALVAAKKLAQNSGVTLSKMLLTGASAGGHLSLMYAYSQQSVSPIEPAAVVSFCGPADLFDVNFFDKSNELYDALCNMISNFISVHVNAENRELYKTILLKNSPISYVDNAVPTVICHGELDNIVPYSNATTLYAYLQEAGVQSDFINFPHSGHGLDQDLDKMTQANSLMLEYAETYLV